MKKVLKFGGTSVGTPENMRRVAQIIQAENSSLTVLSAMSKVTDTLLKIAAGQKELVDALRERYTQHIDSLLIKNRRAALDLMEESLKLLAASNDEKEIVAQGELFSTAIFTLFLQEQGVKAELLHAPDFVFQDVDRQPDSQQIKQYLSRLAPDTYYITQGFVCTNAEGGIDNLGRGGSDLSAALMGVAIGAAEVQIWTDIDGMHNNDPRIVEGTCPIRRMSFDEAAELAYFGAKILHPATIQPCKEAQIPVYLKNTMEPEAPGTEISNDETNVEEFRAVAAKDGITAIRITSTRMLGAYGFLSKVFAVFAKHQTPIDMITTSEVSVALTIDNTHALSQIEQDLREYGLITREDDNTIVCVVGQFARVGLAAEIFATLREVPLKMISYGASQRSLALLIDTQYKKTALQALQRLF